MAKKTKVQDAIAQLQEIALQYEALGQEIKERENKIKDLKRNVHKLLDIAGREVIDYIDEDVDKLILRVNRYDQSRITYDESILIPYLRTKKLVKKICKIVIDKVALEKAYNEGLVDIKVIKKASKVKTTKALRIGRIKPGLTEFPETDA